MQRRRFAIALVLLFAGCATPSDRPTDPSIVVVSPGHGRTWLRRGGARRPLGALDTARVVRLARLLLPDVTVGGAGERVELAFDSAASAADFVRAARWADGLVLSLRDLRRTSGGPPSSDAGVVSEAIRRFLMVDAPAPPPDWETVHRVLRDDSSIWTESPTIAGMGAIILGGLLLRGNPPGAAKDWAVAALSYASVKATVPNWVSRLAYLSWHRNDPGLRRRK